MTLNANNTSGHRGVSWNKQRGQWEAYANIPDPADPKKRRKKQFGFFDMAEEAREKRGIR